MKYLEALAETYNNASSWSTRRQILSVMADITTLDRIQAYLPSVTEFKFTMARKLSPPQRLLGGAGGG